MRYSWGSLVTASPFHAVVRFDSALLGLFIDDDVRGSGTSSRQVRSLPFSCVGREPDMLTPLTACHVVGGLLVVIEG